MKYKRVILKLSGESFVSKNNSIDISLFSKIAEEIKKIYKKVKIGIIIGGGNIFRGNEYKEVNKLTADYAGMLSTVINSLIFYDALKKKGVPAKVQSAIAIENVVEPYAIEKAREEIEEKVVIFAAGTGSPYFTTDTAAALRASELNADVLLKATKVDGIYDKDPLIYPSAKKFDKINYLDALNMKLKVIDSTAISLCMENKIPIIVFSVKKVDNISKVINGEQIGTIIK